MRYVARRGKVGRNAIALIGSLSSILFVTGCSDSDRGSSEDAGIVSDAPPEPWTPVPVEGTICRDGGQTGYAISKSPASRKLLIYMEGGGACFNPVSCLQNPASWPANETSLMKSLTRNWILSRASANSPFKDWNLVFIPYCSGDVHTGSATSGYNGEPQMGFVNYKKDLAEIVPQFPNVDQVVLTGVSAGGFGVAWNWMWTQDAFGSVPVTALDDSGPPMGPDYLAECQQQKYGALWNWQPGLHPSCTNCDLAAGKVVRPLLDVTLRTRTNRLGLLSYDEDGTIKQFFSYGVDNCANWDSKDPPAFPFGRYPIGLAELRQAWSSYPQVAMYVVQGGQHTFLNNDIASVKTGASVSMLEWINQLINKSDGWKNVAP